MDEQPRGQSPLKFVNFKKDSYIIVEGKRDAGSFFIIREGKVRISKEREIVEEAGGGVLGPGDFFGVIAVMSSHSHIESALALTDVSLIAVRKDQYVQLIQNTSPVAMKIIREFSKRLRYLDSALSRLTLNTAGAEATPGHLYAVGSYYENQNQLTQAYYAYRRYLACCPAGEHAPAARAAAARLASPVTPKLQDYANGDFNRTYPRGAMLFAEGEPGEELFIIRRGAVKITKIMNNQEVLLALLKTNDIFGEMALLEAKPRTACAVAFEDCAVLVVTRANFERMITAQPQMIARLTTLLAERLWFIYKQLANTLIVNPVARLYDALRIQLEKNGVDLDSAGPCAFGFGSPELAAMVGLSPAALGPALEELRRDQNLRVEESGIRVENVAELSRRVEFFQKMERLEKARQLSKLGQAGKTDSF